MITLRGLTYTYPGAVRPVLEAVDLTVPAGAFVLVTGASGSGKSTLLRALNGLVPHFSGGAISGVLQVAARNPLQLGPRGMSACVGCVFQDPESQFVFDSVEAELAFAMENHAVPRLLMERRIDAVLDRLGMGHLRGRRISTLSGGEKQRVALASALTLEPQILVLDEPTSQLDPEGAEQVLSLLARLNQDQGITVVLSEHRVERVLPHADLLIHLPGDGTLISGSPREVLPHTDQAPPLVQLGVELGWTPLPLSVHEARSHAAGHALATSSHTRVRAVTSDAPDAITANGLSYAYGEHVALSDANLRVRQGEIVALMGANGSCKTTLLRLLVGLLRPIRGDLYIRGQDARHLTLEERIRTLGYVPQNPNALLFAETVADELAFTRRSHGLSPDLPEGLLEALGIESLLDQYPRDLSVGERQRVALGAILAAEPEIVLLDEPTRGVDRAQKEAFMRYLAREREEGRTLLVATHDVELVAESMDRIVLLAEGSVCDDGPTCDVMARHPDYCSQIGRVFDDGRLLTVRDVLGAVR